MREIEKERLSPMDVCTDFAKTREKFADDSQRHVGTNERRQTRTQQIKTESRERDYAGNISVSARSASKQHERNQRRAQQRRQSPGHIPGSCNHKNRG